MEKKGKRIKKGWNRKLKRKWVKGIKIEGNKKYDEIGEMGNKKNYEKMKRGKKIKKLVKMFWEERSKSIGELWKEGSENEMKII